MPWTDALAPYTEEWGYLYPNVVREYDEDGNPIIPSVETKEDEKDEIRYNKFRKLKKSKKEDKVCSLW